MGNCCGALPSRIDGSLAAGSLSGPRGLDGAQKRDEAIRADSSRRPNAQDVFGNGGKDLPVLDHSMLEALLQCNDGPVAVLCVCSVDRTTSAQAGVPDSNGNDALDGAQPGLASHVASWDGSACLVHMSAHEDASGRRGGSELQLVISTGQGSVALSCVLANAAAVRHLKLSDDQDVLKFLAQSFYRDPGLRTLFHDIAMRLLAGAVIGAKHFVSGDFGRDRYFLCMQASPIAYRATRKLGSAAGRGIGEDGSRAGNARPGPGRSSGRGGGDDVLPAIILELDVSYEGKELAARLQRDSMIMSNIPSIVTMFDMAGRVLHQNLASIAFMGNLVCVPDTPRRAASHPVYRRGPAAGSSRSPLSRYLAAAGAEGPNRQPAEGTAGALASDGPSWAAGAGEPSGGMAPGPAGAGLGERDVFRLLFALEPAKGEEALRAVLDGQEWHGVVLMPASLDPPAPAADAAAAQQLAAPAGPAVPQRHATTSTGGVAAAAAAGPRYDPASPISALTSIPGLRDCPRAQDKLTPTDVGKTGSVGALGGVVVVVADNSSPAMTGAGGDTAAAVGMPAGQQEAVPQTPTLPVPPAVGVPPALPGAAAAVAHPAVSGGRLAGAEFIADERRDWKAAGRASTAAPGTLLACGRLNKSLTQKNSFTRSNSFTQNDSASPFATAAAAPTAAAPCVLPFRAGFAADVAYGASTLGAAASCAHLPPWHHQHQQQEAPPPQPQHQARPVRLSFDFPIGAAAGAGAAASAPRMPLDSVSCAAWPSHSTSSVRGQDLGNSHSLTHPAVMLSAGIVCGREQAGQLEAESPWSADPADPLCTTTDLGSANPAYASGRNHMDTSFSLDLEHHRQQQLHPLQRVLQYSGSDSDKGLQHAGSGILGQSIRSLSFDGASGGGRTASTTTTVRAAGSAAATPSGLGPRQPTAASIVNTRSDIQLSRALSAPCGDSDGNNSGGAEGGAEADVGAAPGSGSGSGSSTAAGPQVGRAAGSGSELNVICEAVEVDADTGLSFALLKRQASGPGSAGGASTYGELVADKPRGKAADGAAEAAPPVPVHSTSQRLNPPVPPPEPPLYGGGADTGGVEAAEAAADGARAGSPPSSPLLPLLSAPLLPAPIVAAAVAPAPSPLSGLRIDLAPDRHGVGPMVQRFSVASTGGCSDGQRPFVVAAAKAPNSLRMNRLAPASMRLVSPRSNDRAAAHAAASTAAGSSSPGFSGTSPRGVGSVDGWRPASAAVLVPRPACLSTRSRHPVLRLLTSTMGSLAVRPNPNIASTHDIAQLLDSVAEPNRLLRSRHGLYGRSTVSTEAGWSRGGGRGTETGAAASARGGALAAAGGEADEEHRWHEVTVRRCSEAGSTQPLIMVVQTDVTGQVRTESALVEALDAQYRLLTDILPRHVVQHMTQRRRDEAEGLDRSQPVGLATMKGITDAAALATSHDCITVLFADIKGFTEMSKEVPPGVVMTFLNDLYTRFDSLTDVYGVYKVETIGDCYMVAGGLVARDGDGYGRAVRGQGDTDPLHAMRVVAFARAMLEEAAKVVLPNTGEPVQLRIGVHSGPATSGVVGQKMPRFCLFGDTVNTASRMESTGRPGAIHASCATRQMLPPEEDAEAWAATGGVEVKGKGRMDTFVWWPYSAGACRQRSGKQQRAMLLGTLSNLEAANAQWQQLAAVARASGGGRVKVPAMASEGPSAGTTRARDPWAG